MNTKQTEPNFNAESLHKVKYTDATSATLPKLPETYDSVNVRIHHLGTAAISALTIGSTAISNASLNIANVTSCLWDITITNIGSGNFLVIGRVIEDGTDADAAVFHDIITELMATTNITLSISNMHANNHYILSST